MSTNRPTLSELFDAAWNSLNPANMATAAEITQNLNDFVRMLINYPGQDNDKKAIEMASHLESMARLASGTLKSTMLIVRRILQLYISRPRPADYNEKLQKALSELDEFVAKQVAETLNASGRDVKKRDFFVAGDARVLGGGSTSPDDSTSYSDDSNDSRKKRRSGR